MIYKKGSVLPTDSRLPVVSYDWLEGAENDRHESDSPSKLQGMKLQDTKLTDQLAVH